MLYFAKLNSDYILTIIFLNLLTSWSKKGQRSRKAQEICHLLKELIHHTPSKYNRFLFIYHHVQLHVISHRWLIFP